MVVFDSLKTRVPAFCLSYQELSIWGQWIQWSANMIPASISSSWIKKITIQNLGKFYKLSLKFQFHFQFESIKTFFTTWQIIYHSLTRIKYIDWLNWVFFSQKDYSFRCNWTSIQWVELLKQSCEKISLLKYPFKVFDDIFFIVYILTWFERKFSMKQVYVWIG